MKIKIEAKPSTENALGVSARIVLARYAAMTDEELIAAINSFPPSEGCDDEICKSGLWVVPMFHANKFATEFLCQLLQQMTGARLDWFYSGGVVIMQMHPKDRDKKEAVYAAVKAVGICSLNYPKDTFYARVYNIPREKLVQK